MTKIHRLAEFNADLRTYPKFVQKTILCEVRKLKNNPTLGTPVSEDEDKYEYSLSVPLNEVSGTAYVGYIYMPEYNAIVCVSVSHKIPAGLKWILRYSLAQMVKEAFSVSEVY